MVSIIMAAFNAEETIEEAILSVQAQTFPDWELLVVDDGSSDETVRIASGMADGDKRIRILKHKENRGVSESRKTGLEASQGEWIAVLDSDDLWTSDKLKKQLSLAEEKQADLVFTGSSFIDRNGTERNWILHVPETITWRELLKQNVISNSSVLVRKELYKKYYAEGDGMHEDFALWLLLLKAGHRAAGIDEPLLVYRLSAASKSSNKLHAAKMNWNTYRYVGLNPLEASWYMLWYTVRGLRKYRHLKGTI